MNNYIDNHNHALAIQSEQTSQAYAALNNAIIATIINAFILVAVLWQVIEHGILLIWLLAILAYSLMRVSIAYQYKKATLSDENIELWSRRFLIGSLLGAVLWGLASVWLFAADDLAHQVFLAFVVGGTAAGAVTSLSYFKIAIYSFLVITLTPLLILFFISQTEFGLAIGTMLTLFLAMMISTANRTHNNIKQNICLSIDNIEQQRFLQQSEQRYKTLLETATDAFFLHDTDGRFLDVNQQACQDLGYTRDELLNMSVSDIETNVDPEKLNQLWRKLKVTKNTQVEGVHRRKDGTTFPVELSIGLVQIDNDMLFSVLARDITIRKQSEADIITAKHEAERANQAKSKFLSRMSHELRTPMNAILGFGQMLELDADEFSDIQRANVKEILSAGNHLLTLINEVLDLAKIEAGRLEVYIEKINLDDALQNCIALINPQLKASGLELIDHISSRGYTVQADSTRFEQVLLNLLSNAVKYNRELGNITLDAEVIDKQRLRISITDTGPGLTEEEIGRLFEPFERLNAANNIEGTGIGLIISKQLVEHMDGTMGVESTLGVGSTFWVELALKGKENE